MSFLSKAVKSVAAPVKKVASVAVNTAAGFAGGGGIGATAGFTKGVIANSKTGRAQTINLRTVGQAAVVGGVANIAAGAAFAGVHALAASLPAGAGVGGIPLAKAGGGSFFSKALDFGKSGGFANVLKKGLPTALSFLGKQGSSVASAAGDAISDPSTLPATIDRVKSGIKKARPAVEKGVAAIERTTGKDFSNNKYVDRLINGGGQSPVIVNTPGGDGGGSPTPPLLLASAGLLLFFVLRKK